jgi:P4 family phage/plasmid primase-like protien
MFPHNKSHFNTKITNDIYSINGKWSEFFSTLTADDKELEEYLQVVFSMCLIGEVSKEGLTIIYGESCTGKSTLTNKITRVLSDYSGYLNPQTLTDLKSFGSQAALAEIVGKRLVLLSETDENYKISSSILKDVSSTDTVKACKKFQQPFSFIPTFHCVLTTNHSPQMSSNDNGTTRRVRVIPLNNKIANPDHNFSKNFSSSEVLNWLIEEAKKYIENGYKLPYCKVVEVGTNKFLGTLDWLQDFLEYVGEIHNIRTVEVWKCYHDYCKDFHEKPKSKTNFIVIVRKSVDKVDKY